MIALVALILALICFILAAVGVASRINLTDIGLACLTVALLTGHLPS